MKRNTLYALIIAFALSAAYYLYIETRYYPLTLDIDTKLPLDTDRYIKFHDYDHDGVHERFEVVNVEDKKQYYISANRRPVPGTETEIVWITRNEPIDHRQVFFLDVNGDRIDEVLLFEPSNRILYLSAYDLRKKQWFQQNIPVLQQPDTILSEAWDLKVGIIGLAGQPDTGDRELFFVARAGYAVHPRGIYRYNFKTRSINKSFETAAAPEVNSEGSGLIFDINDDGKNEIIIPSTAINNVKADLPVKDDRIWLFGLDFDLNPLFDPIDFGPHPNGAWLQKVSIDGQEKALVTRVNQDPTLGMMNWFILNEKGAFENRFEHRGGLLKGYLKTNPSDRGLLYYADEQGIHQFNSSLQEIRKRSLDLAALSDIRIVEPGQHEPAYVTVQNAKEFYILNEELKILAHHRAKESLRRVNFFYDRNGAGLQANFIDGAFVNFSSFKESFWYRYRVLSALGLLVVLFFLILFIQRAFNALFVYIRYFEYALDKSPNPVILIAPDDRIVRANPAFREKLGPLLEKTIHEPVALLLSKLGLPENLTESKKPESAEIQYNAPGMEFIGEIFCTPIHNPFKQPLGSIVEFVDHSVQVTEERLQTWNKSVQKIAHEIKQPLSAISYRITSLKLLFEKKALGGNDRVYENLYAINRELDRINSISRNFMKFTNLNKPDIHPCEVEPLIDGALEHFSAFFKDRILLKTEIDRQHRLILADEEQLGNAIQILIENAIEAMQGNGTLTIKTGLAQKLNSKNPELLDIDIHDTGPGIMDEHIANIFEPFFSTKDEGTGLGLTIAKKIVEDLNGTLKVISGTGPGTNFRIRIPTAGT